MIRLKQAFPLLAVAFCLLLAAFVSPFASSLPDGLEKAASDLGFMEKEVTGVNGVAVAPDYAFPGVSDAKTAKGLAGAFGAFGVLALGAGVGYLIALKGRR